VIVVAAGYVVGAPLFARWLAPRIPPEWEQEIGRSSVEALLKRGPMCADSVAVAGVRSVLDRLLAAAPDAPFEFTLHVSADTSVNAFAAPGGTIVVNAGLLRVAESPEELAGVLAHEVQHVLLRHSMQAVIREVPVRLAIASMTGSDGVETAANVAGTLGALKYRRDNESEADLEGQKLMLAARVDPAGAGQFMRRLESRREDAPRFATYLSSHPRTAERAAELERLAKSAPGNHEPLMDAAAWSRIRTGCVAGSG
jgi:predicted Zn-dependent protease